MIFGGIPKWTQRAGLENQASRKWHESSNLSPSAMYNSSMTTTENTETPYRQGVYALVLNADKDSILMVHKSNSKVWGFPGGGVEVEETLESAVKRELLEELGADTFSVLYRSNKSYKYDWPQSEIDKNFKKFGKLMRGQEQHYFILSYLGEGEQIKIQAEELTEFKWIPLSEIRSYLVYPDLLEYIKEVFSEFGINIK